MKLRLFVYGPSCLHGTSACRHSTFYRLENQRTAHSFLPFFRVSMGVKVSCCGPCLPCTWARERLCVLPSAVLGRGKFHHRGDANGITCIRLTSGSHLEPLAEASTCRQNDATSGSSCRASCGRKRKSSSSPTTASQGNLAKPGSSPSPNEAHKPGQPHTLQHSSVSITSKVSLSHITDSRKDRKRRRKKKEARWVEGSQVTASSSQVQPDLGTT